jgi:hypothetical protein
MYGFTSAVKGCGYSGSPLLIRTAMAINGSVMVEVVGRVF